MMNSFISTGGRSSTNVAEYDYRDENGKLLYQTVRILPKGFRWRRPDGNGGWIPGIGEGRRVLYQLSEVLQTTEPMVPVFVVNGERDVDSLRRLGFIATTNSGGIRRRNQWSKPGFADALRGRTVFILPGNNENDQRYAAYVKAVLSYVPARVKIIQLAGLPVGGGVSDWIAAGGTKEKLLKLVATATSADTEATGTPSTDRTCRAELADEMEEGLRKQVVAVPAKTDSEPTVPAADPGSKAVIVCLADVRPEKTDYVWSQRLPSGMLSLLDGQSSAGKSTVVIDIVARLTTARHLPNESGESQKDPWSVVLIGEEDSPAHTIVPRLIAAGADLKRVHLLRDIGGRMVQLPDDVDEIERVMMEKGARLLVLDPVTQYMAKADLNRDNHVRAALTPLAMMAERTGVAVLMIRHLRKSGGMDAIGRGLGSVGIMAVARAALMLLTDPNDPKARILTWSKLNGGPLPGSLALRFQSTGDGQAARIEWTGTSNLSADDILSLQDRALRGGGGHARPTAVEDAGTWLMNQFEGIAAVSAVEMKRRATLDGIALPTLERARKELGIESRRENVAGGRGEGGWFWGVPASDGGEDSGGRHPKTISPESLIALNGGDSSFAVNSAPNQELGDVSTQSEAKTIIQNLIVLDEDEDEEAGDLDVLPTTKVAP